MSEASAPDFDVVVIGSGVAGLCVALELATSRRVAILTAGDLVSGSTPWAQGGIAAALADDDDPRSHAADTAAAGAGICEPQAVHCLTDAAPRAVTDLIRLGAVFDRDGTGRPALTREGGHRHSRVVHAGGDATGAEVSRALAAAVRDSGVTVLEHTRALDVRCDRGRQVTGVLTHDGMVAARAVVLATGGIGGLYAASTNPGEVAGDGLAIALRAGASLVDLEFVQFHPTALRVPSPSGQIPLVTEALRGEGAVLRDAEGRRIMPAVHPMADLAPRDVVARRVDEVGDVVLDATALGRDTLRVRFPTVYAACRRHGIDPATDPIPVAPAQHFLCGGVRTDSWGATDVVGLYAVGEVAGTGVHGANRLASNSVLEGLVFGRRVAGRLAIGLPPRAGTTTGNGVAASATPGELSLIRSVMSRHAGVRRTGTGLRTAVSALAGMSASNQRLVAHAVVTAALAREESRGCHWRDDFPAGDERWQRHVVVRLDDLGTPVADVTSPLEQSA